MTYKRFLIACSGSIIQYFNYAIFSFSALELSAHFMPGEVDNHKLLNFFAAIILTVLARPLGSTIFGQIGDKWGRKLAITLSGIVSSIGALIVPTIADYNSIGIAASILLIISRMIFLSGLSGEIDGVRLYIAENLSQKKQNLGNGLVTFVTQGGALAASSALYFLSDYKDGWKICFLIGGIAGITFSLLRQYLPESIEYAKTREHPTQYYNVSFIQIISGQASLLLKSIIIAGSIGCMYQFFLIFLPLYTKISLHLDFSTKFIPFYIIFYALGGAVWGYSADRFGNYNIIKKILFLIILMLLILYGIIRTKNFDYIPYIILFSSFLLSGFSVPSQMLLKQRINVGIRYRIFSLGHSIGSLIISTPTGFICTKIAINSGSLEFAIFYPLTMIILSFIAIKALM